MGLFIDFLFPILLSKTVMLKGNINTLLKPGWQCFLIPMFSLFIGWMLSVPRHTSLIDYQTPILDNRTPFELLHSQVPTYTNFRVFGCRVFPYLHAYTINKVSPHSIPCVFIGYSSQYKGYYCLDPNPSRIYITRHAIFDENIFPFSGINASTDLQNLDITTYGHP